MSHTWVGEGTYSFAKKFHNVEFTDGPGWWGSITFQDGPLAEHGANGTTNEDVIEAIIERLEALNTPPYACRENSVAITHLQTALLWLKFRTDNRVKRNVEGTSQP